MGNNLKRKTHSWLKELQVVFHASHQDPVLNKVAASLLKSFSAVGHSVRERPDQDTDLLLTTSPFGQSLEWRKALIFTARREFNLNHTPAVVTMISVAPEEFNDHLRRLETALGKEEPDPDDYPYPGLAKGAHRVIFNQGQRGGPILALERILQAQSKSIRVLLVIGEDQPQGAYLFNLVGAHPFVQYQPPEAFYQEISLRLATALSTHEITDHRVIGEEISRTIWDRISTPQAMITASRELGRRHFFTKMVQIADLVDVPVVSNVVSSQYSEGCFATWDPEIEGLITTVTGSARPVRKDRVGEGDLAVLCGVREDGQGALVRHVEGHNNGPPSSEAVELVILDHPLPRIEFQGATVPVVRSKLHGHRGVASFDPELVEYVRLDRPYYHYPVSCATEAQAKGIRSAFNRSEALQNPDDPRQLVFTVLPGHGVVIAEKWVAGKEPFQLLWEAMDRGALRIDNLIPQGSFHYAKDGRAHVLEEGI